MRKTREEVHEIFECFLTAMDEARAHPGNVKTNENAVALWYDMLVATGAFDIDEEYTGKIIELELSLCSMEKGLPPELREKARQGIERDIAAARERAAKQ